MSFILKLSKFNTNTVDLSIFYRVKLCIACLTADVTVKPEG